METKIRSTGTKLLLAFSLFGTIYCIAFATIYLDDIKRMAFMLAMGAWCSWSMVSCLMSVINTRCIQSEIEAIDGQTEHVRLFHK